MKRSPEAARPSTTISQASSDAARLDVGHGAALQPRALEDDGLLRQPVERWRPRPRARRHRWRNGRRPWRRGRSSRPPGSSPRPSRPGRSRSPFSGYRRRSPRPRSSAARPAAVRPARTRGTRPGRDRVDRGRPAASAPSRRSKATRLSPEARCRRGGLASIGSVDRVRTEMSKAFTKESDGDDEDDLPEEVGGLPRQRQELHDPGGLRPPARGADDAHAQGAARGREGRDLGGRQRRPLGERRLHLRQEAPARDRPPHPLPQQAAGQRRGGRPGPARQDRPGVLRRHRDLRQRARARNAPSRSSASTRSTSPRAMSAGSRRSPRRCCAPSKATW